MCSKYYAYRRAATGDHYWLWLLYWCPLCQINAIHLEVEHPRLHLRVTDLQRNYRDSMVGYQVSISSKEWQSTSPIAGYGPGNWHRMFLLFSEELVGVTPEELMVGSSPAEIMSPGYPTSLQSNLRMTWILTVRQRKVITLQVCHGTKPLPDLIMNYPQYD